MIQSQSPTPTIGTDNGLAIEKKRKNSLLGFVSGQIRCGLGIGKIKVEKCPSTAYTRCQNGSRTISTIEAEMTFLFFLGPIDSRSMKYECALGDGPLGCSKDEQGKKTICSCDTDLCNIGRLLFHRCVSCPWLHFVVLTSSQDLKWSVWSAKVLPQRRNSVCRKCRNAGEVIYNYSHDSIHC